MHGDTQFDDYLLSWTHGHDKRYMHVWCTVTPVWWLSFVMNICSWQKIHACLMRGDTQIEDYLLSWTYVHDKRYMHVWCTVTPSLMTIFCHEHMFMAKDTCMFDARWHPVWWLSFVMNICSWQKIHACLMHGDTQFKLYAGWFWSPSDHPKLYVGWFFEPSGPNHPKLDAGWFWKVSSPDHPKLYVGWFCEPIRPNHLKLDAGWLLKNELWWPLANPGPKSSRASRSGFRCRGLLWIFMVFVVAGCFGFLWFSLSRAA
jgi:hypothetical protein